MIARIPSLTTRLSTLTLATLGLGGPALAADLLDAVPSNSYLVVHSRTTPGSELVDGYFDEIVDAVIDARFDKLIVDTIVGMASKEEGEQIRLLHDHVVRLFEGVPWEALFGDELVFAESVMPIEGKNVGSTLMLAMRVAPEDAGAIEDGLARLLGGLGALDDDMEFLVEVETSDGMRSATSAQVDAALADGRSVLYTLQADGGWIDVAALGFDEDVVLIGLNVGARKMISDSLMLLRGERPASGVTSLTASASFRGVLDALEGADDAYEIQYWNFENIYVPVQDFAYGLMVHEGTDPTWFGLAEDAFALFECFADGGAVTHVDGTHMVTDYVVRFTDDPATRSNPLYKMMTAAPPSRDMLSFVPTEATAFRVDNGYDFVPVYDWVREMVATYLPDGQQYLDHWRGIQALVGIDFEKDVLESIGSEYVSVTMPARYPTQMVPQDNVVLMRPKYPERWRELDRRLTTMMEVWLPMGLDYIEVQTQGNPFAKLELEPVPALEAYPEVVGLRIGTFIGSATYYGGFVDDEIYVVSATSEEALTRVLETGEGKHPSILDDERLADALPAEGPVTSAGLITYQPILEQVVGMLNMFGGMANGIALGIPEHEEEARVVIQTIGRALPRVADIVQRADFVERSISYSHHSEDGLEIHTRSTSKLLEPHERGRVASAPPR